MKKALLFLGVPFALALGCHHDVRTHRVIEERTTTQPQSDRTVILNEPRSDETTIIHQPSHSQTYHQRSTETYEDD
jgi:hypothetical protein